MKWIRFADEIPEKVGKFHIYLFVTEKAKVTMGYITSLQGYSRVWIKNYSDGNCELATHWMELPEPPAIWIDDSSDELE